jgi:hypothetical protein
MTTDADTKPYASASADDSARGPAVLVLATLSLVWLAATLWSAHRTITGFGDSEILALNRAALALPSIVTASLVAGVAVGLAAIHLVGHRLPRIAAGLVGGLVTGLAIAALILIGYGTGSALVVLAGGIAAASLIGGAISTLRPAGIIGAAVAGVLAWFLLGLLQGAFNDRLLTLLGAGNDPASRLQATSRLLLTVAITGGILAGLVAYRYLRPRGEGLRWPAYLAAGAGPGLLLLLANLVAFLAGAQLRALATASREADSIALRYIGTAGINTALVVMFVGAITAMIAFGRTLRPPTPEPEPGQTS